MEVLKKAKVPIIIVIVLFIGFFVYNTVFKTDTTDAGIERTSQSEAKKSPTRDFSSLLTLIKSVDFDDKFFSDEVFRSLVDFSETVKKEDSGRQNPFAPGIVNSLGNISGTGVIFDELPPQATTTPNIATTTQNNPR